MSLETAYTQLSGVDGLEVARDVPLASLTTYRIGGPADLLVEAQTYQALAEALRVLVRQGVPWVVLGRGSNVLAADAGYRGCVVRLGREFSRISFDGNVVCAGAAVRLPQLVNETLSHELAGLECCAGIPGTLGGALSMDAGSRHEWIGRVVRDVVCLRPGGGMHRIAGSEVEWGYRRTSLPAGEIILEATLELAPSTRDAVAREMNRRLAARRASQPTGKACCGSVFKNPGDRSVGMMLEACNLKGFGIGAARVSDVHANFVVNEGGASAADVVAVMRRMSDAVRARFGVELACEVKFLGFEG